MKHGDMTISEFARLCARRRWGSMTAQQRAEAMEKVRAGKKTKKSLPADNSASHCGQ